MLRTAEILDRLANVTGSDYMTAKAFGITPSAIYSMRTRGTILSPEHGLIAAKLLDIPEEFILLSLTAERGFTSPAFKELAALADKYAPKNLSKVAGFLAMLGAGWLTFAPALPLA